MSYQRDFLARKLRDPQAKFVHDLAQIQANQAAENVANITSNLKGYSIKLQTKTTSKDKYYANIRPYDESEFFTGVYPDYNNCRLFIRTENAGKMYDYSLMDNQAYQYGTRQVPDIYIKEDPNDPAKHEFVAYWNGTHYVNVHDRSILNLKSIVENETKEGFSFVRRWLPLKKGNSKQESIILATHTSTSQNQYGYTLTLDEDGNFYFYVKYNYRQYFVKLKLDLDFQTATNANFFYENFKDKNFKTELSQVPYLIKKSYDIACTFNFATKEAVIELRYYDTEENVWSFLGRASSLTENIPDCQINLSLQEGKWSDVESTPLNEVYDSSVNQFVGTINNPEVSAEWQDNNTLKNTHGSTAGTYVSIPNHANINNLTEFSMAFWIYFDSLPNDGQFYNIINKGWNTSGAFIMYKNSGTNDFTFAINNGVQTGVAATNPFVAGQWYFVCCKWKSGEKLKISIDNGADILGSVNQSGTLTNSSALRIHDGRSYNQTIINFMFFNRQITALEQATLYDYGPHLAQFPKNLEPQISPDEELPPITVPFSTLYDLPRITVPTINDYLFLNDPSADSPFASNYNCADGSPSTTPPEVKYNVPEGTGGTTELPPTEVYNLAPASSTGDIQNSERAYVQRIQSTNSSLYGVKVTEIQCWIDSNGDADGQVYLGVIKSDGSYITFGTAVSGSSLGGGWLSVTKTNSSNSHVMQDGDGVGVIWENNNSGVVYVRRGGTGNHDDENGDGTVQYSYQFIWSGSSWNGGNDDYSMAGVVKAGGGTTGTSPYFVISNPSTNSDDFPSMCGEFFGTNSAMKDQIPTKIELKGYKKSGTTGTLALQIFTSSNAVKATLKTWNIGTDASIPTTAPATGTLNLLWEDLNNTISVAQGEKLMLVATSLSTNGEFYIMNNTGNTNNFHSSTSYFVSRLRGFLLGGTLYGATWSNHTTLDLTGKITIGGQSFTAFERFSSSKTRIYERALTGDSSFEGMMLTQVKVRGRRVGTIPAPVTIFCYIRNNSNQIVETIGSMDANEIDTTLEDIFFTNRGADHIVAVGDYVSIEITSCNATNYIELNINNNVADATNSVLGKWEGSATNLSNYDLAGTFFTGGQIDEASRIRVGQYINTQDSIFMTADSSQITYMELALIRVGSPTGNLFVNIRNENDTAVKTLYSGPVSGLSNTVNSPTILFVNTTNTYTLRAKDVITIEYEEGDVDNKIGVMVRSGTNYDGTNSYIARFNGIEYDYDETKDLVAVMKTGGFEYFPDPGSLPPNMPQLSTDIYLGVRADKQGIYDKCISTLFLFTTEILTTAQLDNFCKIRTDIEDLEPEELLVTHHSFIHAE